MGKMYGLAIMIDDKELYDLITKSSFVKRHKKRDGSYTDPEQYIDYAYFLGIRKTISTDPNDIKLTEEEYDKIQSITKFKRVRGGYIHFDKWNKTKNEARVCFMGWNEKPYGIIEYISQLKPWKEYKVEVCWDKESADDLESNYYWMENGQIRRTLDYLYDEERGVMKEVKKFYKKDGKIYKKVTTYKDKKVGGIVSW